MWIKIKDHLPAEGQQIIAFSPDNGTDYPVSIGFWVSYENGLCDAPDGVVARKFAFTHWQPIPDAPQDGHITSGCNLTPPPGPVGSVPFRGRCEDCEYETSNVVQRACRFCGTEHKLFTPAKE